VRILVNPVVLAPAGGVEMSALQVAEELAIRGHSITALYQEPGSHLERWGELATALVKVPSFACTAGTVLPDLPRLSPAIRAAVAAQPDVVYVNRAEHMVWGVLAARTARARLVVHLRTHLPFPGVRWIGKLADHYLAVSHSVRHRWIDAGLSPDRVTVVHNGIEPDLYPFGGLDHRFLSRSKLGIPSAGFVVLYYGRISPEKGVDTLLRAWDRMNSGREIDNRLIIMGDPGDNQQAAYAAAIRKAHPRGIIWLPMDQNVIPALHAADVVVLPAHWQEPFGRVVIEAMCTGRPVVATRVGGIPEILTGEFARYLVDPDDTDALASQLDCLEQWRADDPDLARRARDHVQERFSLRGTVDGIENILLRSQRRTTQSDSAQLGAAK